MNPLLIYLANTVFQKTPNTPVRLAKQEKRKMDIVCEKIAPYVLFTCITILLSLVLIIIIRYGANFTGTEANQFYNHIRDL